MNSVAGHVGRKRFRYIVYCTYKMYFYGFTARHCRSRVSRDAITADRECHLRRCRRRLRKVRNAHACGAGRLLQAAITGCQKQRGGESLARTRVGDPGRPGPQP